MRSIKGVIFGALLLAASGRVVAQVGVPLGSTSQSSRPPYGDKNRENESPLGPATQERLELGRQTERQKKLIADTDRLVILANELKQDMDKSTKDTMSIQVIRKAEEIEKLARSVKDRMKG